MKHSFTKFNLLLIVCVCAIVNGYSQGGGMIWYFGHYAGIDFSSGTAVAVTNGQISTNEGCSSISDCHGNLLSYSDGVTVYDATHAIMPNGTGLTGGGSSSQSALYVPKPCSKDTFYLFTAAAFAGFGGISYNILDMTQNSGKGDIVSKNNVLDNQSTERLTGIKHANGIDYWVLTHDWQNNNFVEYKVTNAGISAPTTIPIGNSMGIGQQFIGVAKFSPNGKKLAVTVYGNGSSGWIDLYDFNTATGALSNRMVLDSAVNLGVYGASFSPNNSLLYVSTDGSNPYPGGIYQFDVSLGTQALIVASRTLIGTSSPHYFGHLQLGPDGRIYAGLNNIGGSDSLGVIKNPNVVGVGCNYTGGKFYLGPKVSFTGRSTLGLPTTLENYYDTAQFANAWPNTVLCTGNSVQLYASGGTLYKWTPIAGLDDPTIANPVATPAATTTYTVSIYDPCNSLCDTIKKTVTVTVNSCSCATTAAATNTSNVNCNGASNGSASVTISNGSGGIYTYSWSNGVTGTTTSITLPITNLAAATYTVTIIDGSCTTTSAVTITQPTVLSVSVPTITNTTCGTNNGSLTLATPTGGTGGYTYLWSNGATTQNITSLAPISYTVTVTDGNGCTSTNIGTITTSNGPNVSSQSSTGTCVGQATGQAAVAVAGGSGPYTYSWSNGVTSTTTNLTSQISNLTSGTYTLTITDANNCTATATALLPLFPNPIANAGIDQTITSGTSIQLTTSGGTSYLWTPSTTLNNAGINNPIANPTQTTTYTVTVTDANSCTSTDDIIITVTTAQTCNASEADEFVANIFTPNGDGRNDVLFVKGSGLTNIYFAIYNRWGQKLFETTDQSKGWDGTQNGKPIDEQTVIYYLKATCITTGENIVKKGDVSVVR